MQRVSLKAHPKFSSITEINVDNMKKFTSSSLHNDGIARCDGSVIGKQQYEI